MATFLAAHLYDLHVVDTKNICLKGRVARIFDKFKAVRLCEMQTQQRTDRLLELMLHTCSQRQNIKGLDRSSRMFSFQVACFA